MSFSFRVSKFGTGDSGVQQVFRPQMTSLIDILTLLLVFLIQSFSSEGALITASEDLKLPLTSSKIDPKPALMVEISKATVTSDGKVFAETAVVSESKDLLIDPLFQYVQAKRKAAVDTAKASEVIIQCDESLKFSVVKKVMFTCSKAGYSDFSVLAVQK